MNTVIFMIFFILIVVVSLLLYIKITSRDKLIATENIVHTKEFLKDNPNLYKKYLEDCVQINDTEDSFKKMRSELEQHISEQVTKFEKELGSKLEKKNKHYMEQIKSKIQEQVSVAFNEEKILKETS